MPRSSASPHRRTLGVLVGIMLVLYGLVASGVLWGNATWSPKLGLDLEGGTEIVLTPVPVAGASAKINSTTINQSIDIIRQRINGNGVSEADVTTQGNSNIVVSLPGKPNPQTIALVQQSAELRFRAVLDETVINPPVTATPTGSANPSATPTGSASATPKASSTVKAPSTLKASPSASSNGRAVPQALLAASATPTASPSAGSTSSPAATSATSGSAATPAPKPTGASDPNWGLQPTASGSATTYQDAYQSLDCTKTSNLQGGSGDDPAKPLVVCAKDGTAKYLLGPAEVVGTDVSSANAGPVTNAQGSVTGTGWQVNLNFTGSGAKKFANVTTRLVALTSPRNQFAIVLDGLVISAPQTNEAITGGQAQITGNFTETTAQTLADQLKFGALPISFKTLTQDEISATLGGQQLARGMLAGLIGLILVVVYSLAQYRALGAVTIASLSIAAAVTYGLVALLSWRQGYRLSLAGVAGLIVSIGITADSFIVFFERVRDEVRDGRSLVAAVEAAWVRARRTILASDAVSFLAAVVLYVLAIGSVRGFAFTLGLTTLVDIMVVFLFTHPTVALLSRTKFFGGGHRLSGFDPVHLGRTVVYAGRGRIRGGPTIAERKAQAERSMQHEEGGGAADESGLQAASTSASAAKAPKAGRSGATSRRQS